MNLRPVGTVSERRKSTDVADERRYFIQNLRLSATSADKLESFLTRTVEARFNDTKTEKFLVIKGHARFCFRHIESGAVHEYCTKGGSPEVVETIPGWSHDITNIGKEEMIVMLWANEIFDRQYPDTITYKV